MNCISNLSSSIKESLLCNQILIYPLSISWWRHQMEISPRYWALCEGNPPVTGGFPSQRQVTQIFDILFDLRLNKHSANDRDAGDLRCNHGHYDVTVMIRLFLQVRETLPCYIYEGTASILLMSDMILDEANNVMPDMILLKITVW